MTSTKRASKVIVLLLSLLMAFSFISTVSASSVVDMDKKGSLTINKLFSDTGISETDYNNLSPEDKEKYVKADDDMYYEAAEDAEYTIYKIATLVQEDEDGKVCVCYKDVNTGEMIDINGLIAPGFDVTDYEDNAVKDTTDSSGYVKFSDLDLALYLVKETGFPNDVANANSFFVQIPMAVSNSDGTTSWEYDVVAYPKNTKTGMKITKEYVSGGVEDADENITANLGDTIDYKITATIPNDFKTDSNLNYKKYNIVDVASKYLTIINDETTKPVVSINGTPADSTYYTITGPTLETDTETDMQYNYTTIAFTPAGLAALNNSDVITVEYSAIIAAEIDENDTTNVIINESYIEYTPTDGDAGIIDPTPDPSDPSAPITPEIYLYSYTIKKVDGDAAALGGAKFVLKKGDNYMKYDATNGWDTTTDIEEAYVVTSDSATGFVIFSGLAYGTDYALVEIQAPKGYTLLKESISIIIDSDSTAETDNDSFSKIVENHKNSSITLPETGGKGIYIFLLVGGALIVTAIVLYAVSRKKTNKAK